MCVYVCCTVGCKVVISEQDSCCCLSTAARESDAEKLNKLGPSRVHMQLCSQTELIVSGLVVKSESLCRLLFSQGIAEEPGARESG
eukprot:SAG31_NODE_3052_length_4740_cov_1.733894_1_plen_86_part_00